MATFTPLNLYLIRMMIWIIEKDLKRAKTVKLTLWDRKNSEKVNYEVARHQVRLFAITLESETNLVSLSHIPLLV